MSNTLSVRITSRKGTTGAEVYEGTVTLCGGRPFKLERKTDKSTQFPTRSAVVGAARNFAKSYGFSDVNFGENTQAAKTTPAAKKAAKKSPVEKKATTNATSSTKTGSKSNTPANNSNR